MKAYRLYQKDLVAENPFLRTVTDRKQYYQKLRSALKECAPGQKNELLTHLLRQVEKKHATQLYLLDAAAVWECYEALVGGVRIPRDIGRGLPFMVDGRMLPWAEIQRLSDQGELPAASVDAELLARLTALDKYLTGKSRPKDMPAVNPRATLSTGEPPEVDITLRDVPQEKPGRRESTQLRKENEQLQKRVQALESENAALRDRQAKAAAVQESEREMAARAAHRILEGKTQEAQEAIGQLDEQLQGAARALEEAVARQQELQMSRDEALKQLEAEKTSLESLRREEMEVSDSLRSIRTEREQAQLAAGRATLEKQEAQQELEKAQEQLGMVTQSLREVRRKVEETNKARRMTQRQLETISDRL